MSDLLIPNVDPGTLKRLLLAMSLAVLGVVPLPAAEETHPLVLWYAQPAKQWVEALPVGNGRLGAMVYGGVESERLALNESTLWTGRPHEYQHEGAAEHLPAIRKLLAEGKQKEAEKLAGEYFMSAPLRQYSYQPLGDLRLKFVGHDQPAEYRRQLDLDAAVATVRYQIDGTTFTRDSFASFPDRSSSRGSPPTSRAR
jgi:alpha-L-fucosidase 2